jgi:hypothetical protein
MSWVIPPEQNHLARRVIRALLWIAAFCFAAGIFLSATLLLRGLPPTPAVAVGRVTIERVSKLRDYLTALLFFVIMPLATPRLFRLGLRQCDRLRAQVRGGGTKNLVAMLFVAPFFLAPFLYLTTFKWGWPLLIPLIASQLLPRAVIARERFLWVRRLFRPEMTPTHTAIAVEALAWILFRYIATGRRIAHIPTLFLEVVFVLFFVALFWLALVAVARMATFATAVDFDIALQRIAVAALPLTILPALALAFVPAQLAISAVMLLTLGSMIAALRGRTPVDPRALRGIVAYGVLPILLYCVSYASTASLTQWIDLFHRGESLGPAFDYLRGKVPYRDVFVLHGLLEDGMLDAWLFRLFGMHAEIALARPVILGSFAVPALWYLGMAVFDSIPLSLLAVLLGAVTTVDNERVFFEIAVLALLLGAVRRNSKLLALLSGVAAGVTLFFSLDIGLYAIGGALLALLALIALSAWRRLPASGGRAEIRSYVPHLLAFLLGTAIGAAPFLGFLASQGALAAFIDTSFRTLPRIIDAVWSLPFPDMTTTFRKDLNLHTISDFFLFEHFRFILNPLVIAVSLVLLAQRAITRRFDQLDAALLTLTSFALLTQRSALGRADFPHQYFSAFLIGPMILILLVRLARSAGRLWSMRDRAAQAFIVLAAVAILPLFLVALWVPDILNARLDDTIHYMGRVSRIGFIDPAAEEIRHRIEGVRYFVWQLSKPGQPIFDFSNQPALYFFCRRPNPTRFYQVPILSPRELQRETILALDRAKPPVVIRRSPQDFDAFDGVDNAIRAQAVAAYIDDYYSFAHSSRGVEIWRRKPDAPARLNLAGYLAKIRVPTLKQLGTLGARSRLVFPSVGSLPGAAETYWRSDLTLHNPFSEAISLGMRYVSGESRADRNVVLLPGQTLRFEDVVRSLFHAPEGKGVLWIEYKGDRPPVARVRTFDAAHGARASIDAPLSMRDAADAGSPNRELTIVGIPGGGARRVNLGVVNVGQIPATFRITVRTRTGAAVGRPWEEGLPEDESRVVSDAEKALHVTLDETSSVHITMIAGTCVAYASFVDANGDAQFLAAVPSQPQS